MNSNSNIHFIDDLSLTLREPVVSSDQQGGSLSTLHHSGQDGMAPNFNFSSLMSNEFNFGDLQQLQQQLGLSGNFNTSQHQQQHRPQQNQPSPLPSPQQPVEENQLNNNHEYLRSLVNQKFQYPSNLMDDQTRQRFLTAPAEPLLQPHLLNDPRFSFMGQGSSGLGGFTTMNRIPFELPSPHALTLRDDSRRMRGGVIEPFPEKLHRLLMEVEATGRSDVISFIAEGKAFAIHKPDQFFKEIVPKYFRQSRLSSFKRQLNLYGFELINTGPSRGGYYHEMFIKEQPDLCRRMRRVAVKVQTTTCSKAQQDSLDSGVFGMPAIQGNADGESDEMFGMSSSNNAAA